MAGFCGGRFASGVERGLRLAAMGAVLAPLMACSSFFQCENKPACPTSTGTGTGTGTSSTVDYAYAAYTTVSGSTSTSYVVGYNIASGALTQVESLPLGFVPVAIAVSPNNAFLYVASAPGAASPGVYAYAISSTGTLTALNSGGPYFTDSVAAMTISPDGEYLYTVSTTGISMLEYPLNTSTGVLSAPGTFALPALNCVVGSAVPVSQGCSVAVSPAKNYVVVSLGTAGDAVFPYATGSGITSAVFTTIAPGTNSGDFSVAIDGNSNAYIAQTSGLTVYGLTNSDQNRGTVAYNSGVVPRGVTTDPDSKFVFTANEGNGTISAFTTGTTTALSSVNGSPFTGPANVSALGVDSSDSYLVAVGYDTSAGVQLWSIAASGVISELKAAGTTTATQYPVLVAMSH